MSKSIRIRTTPGGSDKYVKVKLDQEFDFVKILSLKISQEKIYREFCSDYGVVVGRIIANDGFGVPNAKLSIFVPITDEDQQDPVISSLYPYSNVFTDKDSNGIRYNLLPEESQGDCHTPVGTLPSKRKILDNDVVLDIYEKYYKFTTTTNQSGDYMIFGIPVGNHILHMDIDLSDIGLISQRPYDLIRNGASSKFFESGTKFKSSTNLDSLSHIKTSNTGINVIPFWGDPENCELGITRVDIPLNYKIETNSLFIGSLFSDSDDNAINRRCRPRSKVGNLCDMVTSEGTIEMIRETLSGDVERFDVDGGRVIDEDGTWSYQIPMNLDYIITDEFGNNQPSEDPSKGIATRANVRFRVSMDQTGGDKPARQRAYYLIPNNPTNGNGGDYSFDETTPLTKSGVFTEMKWNKMYTVRNYIPRFQTVNRESTRRHLGIKDVDDCGSHTSFPFNRLDTELNPIFTFLCVLNQIIGLIVELINSSIIFVINKIIGVIKSISNAISNITFNKVNIPTPAYIKCITLECDGVFYAPGCKKDSEGYNVLNDPKPILNTDEYKNCLSNQLAESLEVIEYDFYNDWINGILYLPLYKFKKQKDGDEKFCDYDCDNFDKTSKNDCDKNHIYDKNLPNVPLYDSSALKINSVEQEILDGLIKEINNEFYYAAQTHSSNIPLLLTDISLLGSVLDCDIDGVPSLHASLIPSTYNKPPLVNELVDPDDKNSSVLESGADPLFFDISCLGVRNSIIQSSDNVRRSSELGIGLDNLDNTSGADGIINDEEIVDGNARAKFIYMNTNNPNFSFGGFNSSEYIELRGYTPYGSLMLPRNNSLYFYFGINPGKSAIEKANSKYFTTCTQPTKNAFLIDLVSINNVTTIGGSNGGINISIIGGSAPFIYEWLDSLGNTIQGPGSGSLYQNITNLPYGNYTVKVTDAQNNLVKANYQVTQPVDLSTTYSTSPATQFGSSNGSIIVTATGGNINATPGVINPYTATIISGPSNVGSIIQFQYSGVFQNLIAGIYEILVVDSSSPQRTSNIPNILISEPPQLIVGTHTKTDITCHDNNDGTITISSVSGGNTPYSFSTIGTNTGYSEQLKNLTNLEADIYTITVTDSSGQKDIQTLTIINPPVLIVTVPINNIKPSPGNSKKGEIQASAGGGTGIIKYSLYLGATLITENTSGLFTNLDVGTYNISVKDQNNCVGSVDNIIVPH